MSFQDFSMTGGQENNWQVVCAGGGRKKEEGRGMQRESHRCSQLCWIVHTTQLPWRERKWTGLLQRQVLLFHWGFASGWWKENAQEMTWLDVLLNYRVFPTLFITNNFVQPISLPEFEMKLLLFLLNFHEAGKTADYPPWELMAVPLRSFQARWADRLAQVKQKALWNGEHSCET